MNAIRIYLNPNDPCNVNLVTEYGGYIVKVSDLPLRAKVYAATLGVTNDMVIVDFPNLTGDAATVIAKEFMYYYIFSGCNTKFRRESHKNAVDVYFNEEVYF